MHKIYFENALLDETRSALENLIGELENLIRERENLIGERENARAFAHLTGQKEDFDRVIKIEKALYVCQCYLGHVAKIISDIREGKAFDV